LVSRRRVMPNAQSEGHYRITVDESEDFEVVRAVMEALSAEDGGFYGFDKIRSFLDGHPEIREKNSHVVRNEGLKISLEREEK